MSVPNQANNICLIIPVFNEEKRLPETLIKLEKYLSEATFPLNVDFIDDGSTDTSVQIINNFIDKHRVTCHLHQNSHRGKGYAVKTGVFKAQGEIIVFTDVDLSTPLETIAKAVELINNGSDIVIGSREGSGAKRIGEPFYRHIMGRIFNFVVNLITGLSYKDTQCGFKVFRSEIARTIFSKLVVYSGEGKLRQKAYLGAFDVELLVIAKAMNLKVTELPVTWEFKPTNNLSVWRDSLRMFYDVSRISLYNLSKRYK